MAGNNFVCTLQTFIGSSLQSEGGFKSPSESQQVFGFYSLIFDKEGKKARLGYTNLNKIKVEGVSSGTRQLFFVFSTVVLSVEIDSLKLPWIPV